MNIIILRPTTLSYCCVATSGIPVSLPFLVKSLLLIYIVPLTHCLVGDDFHLVSQEVTFHQGATTDVTQNASVEIIDDSLVEGTESFVVSGDVAAPTLFVPGGDTATVTILDNDGECG